MPSDARSALLDIASHIVLARRWTGGLTLEQFSEDRKTFYAVTRRLEIISEASRRLPTDVKQTGADVPWVAIRDAGNIYRHQYDSVLESRIFNTVKQSLNELDAFVAQELARS
jgi:uncharacterized protein with HEPN domain